MSIRAGSGLLGVAVIVATAVFVWIAFPARDRALPQTQPSTRAPTAMSLDDQTPASASGEPVGGSRPVLATSQATGDQSLVSTPTDARPAEAAIPVDPEHTPTPLDDSKCQSYLSTFDGIQLSIGELTQIATKAIFATTDKIGDAQWNTKGGLPPAPLDADALKVMRVVRFQVDSVLKGDQSDIVAAWLPGGKIGCNVFALAGLDMPLAEGDQAVVFLGRSTPANGLTGIVDVMELWPVDAAGDVVTPYGTMTRSEVRAAVQAPR